MGFWKDVVRAFSNEEEENPNVHNIDVSDSDATWRPCSDKTNMWQLEYAMTVVQRMLATVLTNVTWKTFKQKKPIQGDEWFRLNISPNRKQTSAEFFMNLASKLVYNGEALIIETASRELFIADSYSFKNGQELLMKDNTFINVVIGQTTLNRTFKENDSCIYIKTPNFNKVLATFQDMGTDFYALKELVYEGAQKALGMKLNLNLGAMPKNKYDDKYIKEMQKVYKPLMKERDAVFVTYKGETLDDLTEKQRGSEVQQVLTAVENNIKVNDEIVCNIGMAYGIPQKFMKGDLTADNNSVYEMLITLFAKPYLKLLSQKFTFFVLTKEDIIAGSKVEAELNSIKFIEKLAMATSVDKLIGSGAYNPNEVREMLDDDPFDGGDVRFITKNYAVLSEYAKGGSDTT